MTKNINKTRLNTCIEMNEKTRSDRDKLLNCLLNAKEQGVEFLWIRELSRRTGINLGTVNWILYRYLYPDYIDFPEVDALLEKGLKIRPVRIKESAYKKLNKAKSKL